jgi:hypothetical protein
MNCPSNGYITFFGQADGFYKISHTLVNQTVDLHPLSDFLNHGMMVIRVFINIPAVVSIFLTFQCKYCCTSSQVKA